MPVYNLVTNYTDFTDKVNVNIHFHRVYPCNS